MCRPYEATTGLFEGEGMGGLGGPDDSLQVRDAHCFHSSRG